jgi:hypothetical protein
MQKIQKRRLRDGTTSIKDDNVSYLQRLKLPCVRNLMHGGPRQKVFLKKEKASVFFHRTDTHI